MLGALLTQAYFQYLILYTYRIRVYDMEGYRHIQYSCRHSVDDQILRDPQQCLYIKARVHIESMLAFLSLRATEQISEPSHLKIM